MVVSQNWGVHGCPKHFFFGSKNKAWGTRILRQSQMEKHKKKQKMKNEINKTKLGVPVWCKFAANLHPWGASLMIFYGIFHGYFMIFYGYFKEFSWTFMDRSWIFHQNFDQQVLVWCKFVANLHQTSTCWSKFWWKIHERSMKFHETSLKYP